MILSLLAAVLLWFPGSIVARAASGAAEDDDEDGDDDAACSRLWLVSLVWSFGLVPSFAFFFHLATEIDLSIGLLAAFAASALIWIRRARLPRAQLMLRKPALAAAAIGLAYLVAYDASARPPADSCVNAAALIATGDDPAEEPLLSSNPDDARYGSSAVIAGQLAIFGGAGFRALYALCGALLALGGYTLGRRIGAGAWGWAGMAVLALNPYVFSIPQADENLLALAFTSALFPILWTERWALAGLVLGLGATMREPLAATLPAVLLVVWRGGRWRALAFFAAALLAQTFFQHLHHHLAFGSVFTLETNAQYPPFDYSLFGVPFRWRGLLNWPFHDTLVRTPHNPFPVWFLWPLHYADRAGLAAAGLAAVGLFAVRRDDRLFWILWWLPVQLGLSVQEGWDYPNKMGVFAILLHPIAIWTLAGARLFARKPVALGAALGIGAPAVAVAWAALLADWRAPADARYSTLREAEEENPAYVSRRGRRESLLGLSPDFDRLSDHGPFFSTAKLSALTAGGDWKTHRPWGWAPGEIEPRPAASARATLRIDLSEPPYGRNDFVTTSSAIADLSDNAGFGLQVDWDPRAMGAFTYDGRAVASVVLFFGRCGRDCEQRMEVASYLAGDEDEDEEAEAEQRPPSDFAPLSGPVLLVSIPEGPFSLAVVLNARANRAVVWKGRVRAGMVELDPPFEPWHN